MITPNKEDGYRPFYEAEVLQLDDSKSLFRRYNRFRSRPNSIKEAKVFHRNIHSGKKNLPPPNKALLKYYHEVIEKAKDRNNTVIFHIPPMFYPRSSMIALYNNLPDQNKLPLLNPKFMNQKLFFIENWLDDGHLMEPGARLYSPELGKQIGQHLRKHQININQQQRITQ
jgi:hypothetical protein